ncbi:hypothetical protein AGR7C_Cc110081 [Agrobacterium deltaense Zutra 3/1]|uniref:Uncharacterized protein n=1 Tax=Agrobacterium deltaense Zutra 3/1 TaxID=1183427 RepID=A0A1S7NZ69_9HYPH|nr:hypothetical protein AGR7C_Cc110081 [Agrobacterium deltaense Zutra 3/1]
MQPEKHEAAREQQVRAANRGKLPGEAKNWGTIGQ